MRHGVVLFLFVLFILSSAHGMWVNNAQDTGGGSNCAACTIIVSLLDQVAVIQDKEIDKLLDEVCDWFPPQVSAICAYLVNEYGEAIIQLIAEGLNPDEVCQTIDICTNATCHLWPKGQPAYRDVPSKVYPGKPRVMVLRNVRENPWDWLMNLINRLANQHEPILDFDSDLFSDIATLRGSNWRGKDCQDWDHNIYPGKQYEGDEDPTQDWNCNGIMGVDQNKVPYEDSLCSGTGALGTIVLGDSVGAHFSIPPSYMTATEINETTYQNILPLIENEIDWPQRSAWTGFENSTSLPMSSLYKYMRARNHCNHRDYQNIAVNGARSGALEDNIVISMARNQTLDKPALVLLELVGNDVCNPHPTLDTMTTPAVFKANIIGTLQYLDTHLPSGSHVVFIGLADGRALYDTLHNRTHPIGATYEAVYDYLNCLQINPCWVWLNSDENIRNAGTVRAMELTQTYKEIMGNYTFEHFDMAYYDFPWKAVEKVWLQQGGEMWQLIEPIDGFHPDQTFHSIMADYLWKTLSTDHPDFLSPVNPNNKKIEQLFGDQGGY